MKPEENTDRMHRGDARPLITLLLASVSIVMIIIVLGSVYAGYEKKEYFENLNSDLSTIADLKTSQIISWLDERKSDAAVIASIPDVRLATLRTNGVGARQANEDHLASLFDAIMLEYSYEAVVLTDSLGRVIGSSGVVTDQLDTSTLKVIERAITSNSVIFSDFYRCALHGTIHLDIVAPVKSYAGPITGAVILRINPHGFLYPLIQKWPTGSKTAETLIVRRHGKDSIEFLNELRHMGNTALNLRIGISGSQEIPAVAAVSGISGFFEGVDYRNARVLSYLNPVPGTSWYMVNKVDRQETLAVLREHQWTIAGMIILFTVCVILYTAWRYNRRIKAGLMLNLEKEKEVNLTNSLFRVTLYSIGDGVITTDQNGKIMQMNPEAERMTGWSEDKAIGRDLSEVFRIFNEFTGEVVENPVEKVIREGLVVGLANHTMLISKDSRKTPIADSGAPIRNDSGELKGVVLVFRDQTEERKAEIELMEKSMSLSEAKRQLTTLIGNLPGIAYRCRNDHDWTMEFISDGCLKVTGYRKEDLLGSKAVSYNSLIDEEYRSYVWESIQTAISEKTVYQLEYKILTREGDPKWVWEQGSPVLIENEVIALEGFITDITERKKAENIIMENEKRFRSLIDISQLETENIQALLDYALHEALKLTSSSLGYIYHYSEEREEFILNTWSKNVMKECTVLNPETCYELARTGIWGEAVRQRKEIMVNDFQATNPLKKGYPEGHVSLWNYLTIPVFDRNRIIAVVGVANKTGDYTESDINQLKLLMDSVWKMVSRRKSEELVRQMSKALEQSPVSIVITDSQGKIVYVNPRFTLITGYSIPDVEGRLARVMNTSHPDSSGFIDLWEKVSSGHEWRGEYRNRKKSGEEFWESVSIQAVRDDKNEIINYVIIAEDITERRQMVSELIEARDKAEEMNRLKSRFLANMSHELRTPMNGIIGFSELLTSEDDLVEIKKMADIINRSASRLMLTLNNILDLSRIESGAGKPVVTMTDIAAVAKETVELFRAEAIRKSIGLFTEGCEEPIVIETDQRIIHDILRNLVNNALKFTLEGSVRVVVINQCSGDHASNTVIEVHDTGIGISEEEREIIFDEFRQGSEGYSRSFEGSGLGLSICRKYLNLLGGSIDVRSTLGKGSVFRVMLPCKK